MHACRGGDIYNSLVSLVVGCAMDMSTCTGINLPILQVVLGCVDDLELSIGISPLERSVILKRTEFCVC